MRRTDRIAWAVSVTLGAGLLAIFAHFWFSSARVVGGTSSWLGLALFAVLSAVVWHRIAMDVLAHVLSSSISRDAPPPPPEPGLSVAFITTYVPGSEPLDMLERTLRAMLAADYPHETWVLDEGDDPAAQALCLRLGVRHFSRKGVPEWNTPEGTFAARTKGGNHNAWYVAHGHTYDVVAQIDTDFVVRRDFLTATLGHFRDPEVAWVVTPQIYGNDDVHLVAAGAGQQQFSFYGPVLRGLSGRGSALLLGANHVIRVSALESVGWYEGHLTEDLATGIKLHASGWKSRYVPEPLAIGEGPTTWQAYFKQQFRWAYGCYAILFRTTPRLLGRLGWERGLLYLWLQLNYFSGVAFVVGGALIAAYFVTGRAPGQLPLLPLAAAYAPYLVWRQLHWFGMQRYNVRPRVERGWLWPGRIVGVVVQPLYAVAMIGSLLGRHLTFHVTPKGDHTATITPVGVYRTHLYLALAMTAAMAIGLLEGHTAWAMLAWGGFTTLAMLLILLAEAPARTQLALRVAGRHWVTALYATAVAVPALSRSRALTGTGGAAAREAVVIDLRDLRVTVAPALHSSVRAVRELADAERVLELEHQHRERRAARLLAS
ncbi:Glycosyltransferase, catalytic subunit of cellulose synthase and poly-beta-1,6-N-acetylglucosamine synthase [Quadrisphaera granulorum]|uniref:Cellulose synthase/poly-beta-1,6-N-acetylglucosamine synthase-like glycosyltransferase n=2 Tax=Quadrisphaera granulorum TaxID=317664 RepID=A0A316ABQ6_9ACTN|nr:cellulose synthase/poly-beta-1,6-N-acetylglucosamine synthase-like glycosyltransferase [Quadrisphaera granulorum]SZE95654.1 Glycosyltransferase, catalytic subunit of cellulose synthase and poly-beta-1,6-N-acetylglucosamine synthase [Quadrisphaera granulorum]